VLFPQYYKLLYCLKPFIHRERPLNNEYVL
jgi:hypothetical protein